MSFAWFIVPYKRKAGTNRPKRYCAMDDFTASGAFWSETEILGDVALVKVSASDALLAQMDATVGFLRIPSHFRLSDTLGDLTTGQRNAILNKLQALGYTLPEIQAAIPVGGWTSVTLGQVLRFAATRRLRPRYDVASDTIICDGPSDPVRPVNDVDASVFSG